MTLETSDYNTYDDYSVVARIYASDPYSDVEDMNEVYDQFTIEVRDECHDIQTRTGITVTDQSSNTATASSPFTFYLW